MTNEKYELLLEDKFVTECGKTLYRIRALKDIGELVKAGDLGGYIESEKNLSFYGAAWIGGDASVFVYAKVFGDARVSDDASVSGNAEVFGHARVSGNAEVFGDARVSGYAKVFGDAQVSGTTILDNN